MHVFDTIFCYRRLDLPPDINLTAVRGLLSGCWNSAYSLGQVTYDHTIIEALARYTLNCKKCSSFHTHYSFSSQLQQFVNSFICRQLFSQQFFQKNLCSFVLLGLLAKIKVAGVLPAHLPLVLDAGTVLVSVPLLSCAGFVGGVRQYTR